MIEEGRQKEIKKIYLIWAVRYKEQLTWFSETFNEISKHKQFFSVHLFVTRNTKKTNDFSSLSDYREDTKLLVNDDHFSSSSSFQHFEKKIKKIPISSELNNTIPGYLHGRPNFRNQIYFLFFFLFFYFFIFIFIFYFFIFYFYFYLFFQPFFFSS